MQFVKHFSADKSGALYFLALVYLSAIMPFQQPGWIAPGIALLTGVWLFSGNLKNKIQNFYSDKNALLLAALYLFYAAGYFYSEDKEAALTDLVLKLPVLLIPLAFSSITIFDKKEILLKIFHHACLLSALYCLSRAAYFTLATDENHFYYAKLSVLVHVGHYAMFLAFAAFVSLHFFLKSGSRRMKIFYSASFLLFAFVIVLLSARAQFLAFLFLVYTGIIVFFFSKKKFARGILILVLSITSCVSLPLIFPLAKERFVSAKNEMNEFFAGDREHYNATSLRLMTWEAGVEVVKKNFFFGTGSGDVKKQLHEEARKKNYGIVAEKNLNYHNQFIQTWAATGLPGLLALISAIVLGLYSSIHKKEFFAVSFFMILSISFLTESVLERQTGVIFYSYFAALLTFAHREKYSALG